MSNAVIGSMRIDLGLRSVAFEKGINAANKRLARFDRDMKRFGRRMQRAGRQMSVAFTAPIAGLGVAMARTAGNFEAAMNRVAAVSGATAGDLEKLRELAKQMGKTTQFSASQAADAMGFLAQAGFQTRDIMDALPGTLQLAAAAQMELGRAADIVSNVLSGYGLEVEKLGHANDVLVKTFTSTNTNLEQLGEAMKYAAPVASAAGVQFEEAAAALGLMGNAGIQASMAGTTLRGAIAKILDPSKEAQKSIQRLGLSFVDSEGRLKGFDEIVRQLEPHVEDAGLFLELFGQRAGPGMAALVSQGSASLTKLTRDLEGAGGTAEAIANAQMAGFNGAMKRLQSAFEGLLIAIGDSGILDALTAFTERLAAGISKMAEADPQFLKITAAVAALVAGIGPLLIGLGALAGSLVAIQAAAAPLLLIVAGAAGLIWAYNEWKKSTDTLRGATDDLKAALDDSKKTREQDIALTEAAIEAQLKEARAKRENLKAELELQRARAAQRLSELQQTQGSQFGWGGISGSKEYAAARDALKEAERELAAQDKHIYDLSTKQLAMALDRREGIGQTATPTTTTTTLNTSVPATKTPAAPAISAEAKARRENIVALEAELAAKIEADRAERAMLDDLARVQTARSDAHRSVVDQIKANHELAAAYKISAEEGRLVAEMQRIQASGVQYTTEKLREMATASLQASDAASSAMEKSRDAAIETGDAMEDAFTRGANAFTSLIKAIESGDIGSILSQGLQFLAQLSGKNGKGGNSGFAGFFDKGGIIPSGKWGIAGENGPELIRGGMGGVSVMSRLNTSRMMGGMATAGGSSAAPIRIEVVGKEGPMFAPYIQSTSASITDARAPAHAQSTMARGMRMQAKRGKRRLAP